MRALSTLATVEVMAMMARDLRVMETMLAGSRVVVVGCCDWSGWWKQGKEDGDCVGDVEEEERKKMGKEEILIPHGGQAGSRQER